jgi:hypothetical protein
MYNKNDKKIKIEKLAIVKPVRIIFFVTTTTYPKI